MLGGYQGHNLGYINKSILNPKNILILCLFHDNALFLDSLQSPRKNASLSITIFVETICP